MAAELDLDSFLNDISQRDQFLTNMTDHATSMDLPPVRGADDVPVEKPKPPPAKKPAAATKAPSDGAAIWEEEEVEAPAEPVVRAVAGAKAAVGGAPKATDEKKPRQRKHAYEYFNQWDAYDVDGELTKLEDKQAVETAAVPESEDDGLPPGLTASMLATMPAIEVNYRLCAHPPSEVSARGIQEGRHC